MTLQQIDVDILYPNGERGVPARTANIITNENAAETEQRLSALESGDTQVEQTLAAHAQQLTVHTEQIALLNSGFSDFEANLELTQADLQAEIDARKNDWAAFLLNLGRNRLINGNFDVWQRGVSFGGTTWVGYTADRFYVEMGSMTGCTCTRQPVSPGNAGFKSDPVYAMQFDYTGNTSAAAHYLLLHHRAEDVRTFAGRPSVLSFTVFNSGAAGRQVSVEFIQSFGTGGSASLNGLVAQKITLTAGFNYVELPITLPSVAGKSIGANSYVDAAVWLSGGTDFNARNGSLGAQSGQLIFSAFQWEKGSAATAFENLPLPLVIANCQRYFEKSYLLDTFRGAVSQPGRCGTGATTVTGATHIFGQKFKVTKRATPACALNNPYTGDGGVIANDLGNNTSASLDRLSDSGFEVVWTNAAGRWGGFFHWVADAEIY